jgi:hypothetical protein
MFRRALLVVAATFVTAVAAVLTAATPASAHHGFTGKYDASRPLYVQGTVQSATYGYPHGLIHITPGEPTTAPSDLSGITAQEQQNLGGLNVVTGAAPVRATGEGQVTLLLPPPMTTEVAARGDRPEAGDQVGAVVFRECTTGELRVQLLRISDQERVVRSGVMQTEVQACPGGAGATASAQPSQSNAPSPGAANAADPVTVPTEQEPTSAPWSLVAALGLLAAAVTGAVLVVAARAGNRSRKDPS